MAKEFALTRFPQWKRDVIEKNRMKMNIAEIARLIKSSPMTVAAYLKQSGLSYKNEGYSKRQVKPKENEKPPTGYFNVDAERNWVMAD